MSREFPDWYSPMAAHAVPPCIRAMTNFTQHKLNSDSWYSPPFYTGPGGYKLQLRVDANGSLAAGSTVAAAKGSHVSIALYTMKGDNDDCLGWPFRGSVAIKLLNWTEDENHLEHTFTTHSPLLTPPPSATDPTHQSFNRVIGAAARSSIGLWRREFVAHEQLEYNPDYQTQYLMEDVLCFTITVATVVSGKHPSCDLSCDY